MREVMRLCAEGAGVSAIIRGMEGVPSSSAGKRVGGGGWAPSSVRRLLTDRTLIGELQLATGEVVSNHYPQTIDPDLWAQAQAAVERRRAGSVIREQKHVVVFAGISWCAACGGTMGRAAPSPPRGIERLVCRAKHATGKCKTAPSHSMAKAIRALTTALAGSVQVVERPRPDDKAEQRQAQARLDVDTAARAVDTLYDGYGATPSESAKRAIERAEQRLAMVRAALGEVERHMVVERGERPLPDATAMLIALVERAAGGDEDARREMGHLLRQIVRGSVCYPDREIVLVLRCGVVCGVRDGAGLWWRFPGGDTVVRPPQPVAPGFHLTDRHVGQRAAHASNFVERRIASRGKSVDDAFLTLPDRD